MADSQDRIGAWLESRGAALTGGIVALAVVLRLPDLFGWWVNPDEGIYFGAITRDRFGDFWAEAVATAHPPLYFLVLRVVSWVSTELWVLRSVAFVFGCIAVYLFILVGREIGGDGRRGIVTGLVSGLLLAVSPRAVVLSQVIRPYMLLLVLLSGSLLLLLRYLRRPSTGLLVGHAVCSALALCLHYSAALALAAIGAIVLAAGFRRTIERGAWLRLFGAQCVSALLLVVLYLTHLGPLMSSPMADNALEGWLSTFMIYRPADVWIAFLGVHSMLFGVRWALPAAVLTLASIGLAAWRRSWVPVVVMTGTALVVGLTGAALQAYPFGPTRHTIWAFTFLVPTLAWAGATLATSARQADRWGLLGVCILAGATALAYAPDTSGLPSDISEHLTRSGSIASMAEVLEPTGDPSVVLMSTETYEFLTPLFADDRQVADTASTGRLRHFRWGDRDAVVIPRRDFLVRPDQVGESNHLLTAAREAEREFDIRIPPEVLLLAGGWRSQGMLDLADLADDAGIELGPAQGVPGLIALTLDFQAYSEALR